MVFCFSLVLWPLILNTLLLVIHVETCAFVEQGHLHTYRFCDNVWTFILQDAVFKSEECQETVNRVKIVACDSKLLTQ